MYHVLYNIHLLSYVICVRRQDRCYPYTVLIEIWLNFGSILKDEDTNNNAEPILCITLVIIKSADILRVIIKRLVLLSMSLTHTNYSIINCKIINGIVTLLT